MAFYFNCIKQNGSSCLNNSYTECFIVRLSHGKFSSPLACQAGVYRNGNPRRYRVVREDGILLAAGRLGKSVAAVSLGENGHLRLEYPKHGNFQLPAGNYSLSHTDFNLPGDDGTLLPIYNLRYLNSPFYQAAIIDAKNNLLIFHPGNDVVPDCVGHVTKAATEVLAAARLDNRFVYVGRESSTQTTQIVSYGEKTEKRELPFAQVTQALFGRGTDLKP